MVLCQMLVGINKYFFENTDCVLLHFKSIQIQSIGNLIQYIDATIELDNVLTSIKQREFDVHLMDDVLESSLFSKIKTKHINAC